MNNDKLEQILKGLSAADVPAEVRILAEETGDNFTVALKLLQSQESLFSRRRIIGYALAAAAMVVLAFIGGFMAGVSGHGGPPPAHGSAVVQASDGDASQSFWRAKAIAIMESKPQLQGGRQSRNWMNAYRQYKERNHE